MTVLYILLCIVVILFAAFVFLIKPSCRRYEMPCDMFAHRGLHNAKIIPENSKAAFENARAHGCGVELDVQYTKDKKLVVFHDDNIKRVCGVDKNVSELTYEELLTYPLYNTQERVPLFSEVLEIMGGLPVICEIKTSYNKPDEEVCREVALMLDGYGGKMMIESFNPLVIGWFKKHRPDIIRGQLAFDETENQSALNLLATFALEHLMVNCISRPDFIAYRYTDDCFGYKLCRKLFKPVCIAWTPRGNAEIEKAKRDYKYIIYEQHEVKTEL